MIKSKKLSCWAKRPYPGLHHPCNSLFIHLLIGVQPSEVQRTIMVVEFTSLPLRKSVGQSRVTSSPGLPDSLSSHTMSTLPKFGGSLHSEESKTGTDTEEIYCSAFIFHGLLSGFLSKSLLVCFNLK